MGIKSLGTCCEVVKMYFFSGEEAPHPLWRAWLRASWALRRLCALSNQLTALWYMWYMFLEVISFTWVTPHVGPFPWSFFSFCDHREKSFVTVWVRCCCGKPGGFEASQWRLSLRKKRESIQKKKSQSAFSSPEVMVIKLKHVSLHQVMCDTICTLFISLTPYNSGPECCYSRSCHWDTNRFICFVCGLFHSLSLSPVMRPGWPDKCPCGYQTNVTFLFTARVSFSSHTRTTLFFSKSVPFNLLQNLPYDLLLSSVSIHCDRLTSPCYRWWADDSRFKYTSLHQHCLT